MPLAAACHENNLGHQINELSEYDEAAWDKLKLTLGETAPLQLEDIVFIGVRDVETPERNLLDESDCLWFGPNQVNEPQRLWPRRGERSDLE